MEEGRVMKLKCCFRLYPVVLLLLLALPITAQAQFGGTTGVFDPQMFARQVLQLQQETAAVTNLAQQLQYMIKNTPGGRAVLRQSNHNLLGNRDGLVAEA